MQNNFGLNFKTNLNKVSGDFSKFYSETRKVNNRFNNITKDANRASSSINGLGKSFIGLNGIIKGISFVALAKGMGTLVNSSLDVIETTHLFSVSMGDMAEETQKFIDTVNGATGLDTTNIQNTIGTFSLLARSMGMTTTQAKTLSTNTYQLGVDLASLANVPVAQAMQDLHSGLVGQARTMYKYGIDVTEATLKQEALRQGITKSVRNMSQGEKMALRYSAMIRQSALSHGDFAETINSPANQLKILGERMATLGRTIGSVFVPALKVILPYLNAMVQVLTKLIGLLATFFGYEAPEVKNTGGGLVGIEEDADDATDAIDKTGKALKKLSNLIGGFDELNVMQKPSDGKSGGNSDVGGAVDFELPSYDALFGDIKQKSDEIAKSIENVIGKFAELSQPLLDADLTRLKESFDNLWESLKPFGNAIGQGLIDFYTIVLVPLGVWTLTEAFPRLADILSKVFSSIDWDKINDGLKGLFEALTPFAITVGEGLLWFLDNVLAPLAIWTWNNIVPIALDAIKVVLELLTVILEAFKPLGIWLWENFLKPLAEWTGGIIVTVLEDLVGKLQEFTNFLSENQNVIKTATGVIAGFFLAWKLTEVMAFISMSGGLISTINLIKDAMWGLTGAKLADKMETMYLIGLYAKDFILALVNSTKELVIQTGKFVLNTIQVGLSEVALIAHTTATKLWNVATKAGTIIAGGFGKAIGVLTSPIGLVVVAITALIAIGVLLYKNWDEIKDVAIKVWDKITEIWGKTKDWFNEKVAEPIKNAFDTMYRNITDWVDNKVRPWFTISKWKDIMKGVGTAFQDVFKNAVNGAIGIFNRFIGWVNDKMDFTWDAITIMGKEIVPSGSVQLFRIPRIPQLARGGSLERGQIFEAGEFGKAELLGGYQGKTTVMPLENSGFVEAIYGAVRDAISESEIGENGGIIVNIGDRTIFDSLQSTTNRQSKISGKNVYNV